MWIQIQESDSKRQTEIYLDVFYLTLYVRYCEVFTAPNCNKEKINKSNKIIFGFSIFSLKLGNLF